MPDPTPKPAADDPGPDRRGTERRSPDRPAAKAAGVAGKLVGALGRRKSDARKSDAREPEPPAGPAGVDPQLTDAAVSNLRPADDVPPMEVARTIVRLKLADKAAVKRALGHITSETGGQLVDRLLAAGELTDFQAAELRRGEMMYLAMGPFRPQYLLAAGSFARVFRGVDVSQPPGSERHGVAIKILRERWRERPGMVDMFRREGELGQRLTHRNIVPIWTVDTAHPVPHMTMEFVPGGDLRDFLKLRTRLDPPDAVRAGLDICRGLQYALQFGVAHRDLKLSNVLMSPSGESRLIDFGLAADESLLDEAELHNALEYATLEKHAAAQYGVPNPPGGDPRSDLYLLGTILYELVSGEPPYPRTADRQERKQVTRYRNIRPLAEAFPDVPACVARVTMKLLSIDPRERYQTPAETATALQAALVELGEGGAVAGARTADGKTLSTLLCVESRPKHQDVLREYFSKHGFRVLLLGDPERALSRLDTNPPDVLVLMGDAIGPEVVGHFQAAMSHARPPACVLVAPKAEADAAASLDPLPKTARVLTQPATTRELRKAVERCLAER